MKNIAKEKNTTIALVVLCQDYVLFDDELMRDVNIKKNLHNEDFWAELSKHLYGTIKATLEKMREDSGEYDEFEDTDITESEVLHYVLNTDNRFDLNDMILETVEAWLLLKGRR